MVVAQEAYWHICLPPCCLVKLLSGFIQATAEDYKIESKMSMLLLKFLQQIFFSPVSCVRKHTGNLIFISVFKLRIKYVVTCESRM